MNNSEIKVQAKKFVYYTNIELTGKAEGIINSVFIFIYKLKYLIVSNFQYKIIKI